MGYSAQVLEHFHRPRHAGDLGARATAVVEVSNPVCGDVLKLWAKVDAGQVREVSFKAEGCIPAVACGSWLADWLSGKNLKALPRLSALDIESALGGLPPASKHAVELALAALEELAARLKVDAREPGS